MASNIIFWTIFAIFTYFTDVNSENAPVIK